MVLEKIVRHKKSVLNKKWPDRSIDMSGVKPSARSFKDALLKDSLGFVLECKKASPSKGLIREDFNVEEIAAAYAPFADCISVLTDEEFFKGSLDYLDIVSKTSGLPILCKDFILEPFQVYLARKKGADALLLMMSVLDDDSFRRCFDAAKEFNLDALVEVRDRDELDRALKLGAQIIGINNRNLDDLKVDLSATRQLAAYVPKDRVLISESGILTHKDVTGLKNLVDGFLVGSSIMSKDNLTIASGELLYGRVKVCGITSNGDAVSIAKRGVFYGGLIFAEGSVRKVSLDDAEKIKEGVNLNWVGVFKDQSAEFILECCKKLHLSGIQLHGSESPGYVSELKKVLPESVFIWKAFTVKDAIPDISLFKGVYPLFDSRSPGSGKSFNWLLLEDVDLEHAIIAGGLSPENADRACELGAMVLDVNSGVESAAGKKDMTKLDMFLKKLRGNGRRRE